MTIAAASTVPAFDPERLSRQTYLTSAEAAFYLGYTAEAYADPLHAFHVFLSRHAIKRFYLGRRLRFQRVDLDQFLVGDKRGRHVD